jgi:hypothetical protein
VKDMPLNITVEKRPNSILLVVLLPITLGIYMIVTAVHAMVTETEYILDGILVLASLDSFSAGILSLIIGIVFFILGFGLWNMMGWSRIIILSFAGLGVVFYPLRGLVLASNLADSGHVVVTAEIVSGILTIMGIVISIIVLMILSRQEVILAFEANEMVRTKKRIVLLKEKMEIGRKRCNEGEITKAELSNLRSECLAEERVLKGRIRHFEKVRLVRERKIKDRLEKKIKAKEDKIERQKKRAQEEEEEEEEEEPEEEEDQKEDEKSVQTKKKKAKKKT